jgi:hypothetical protein
MAVQGIGPLLGADENLNHQIVDTFATLAQSDQTWTEKLWGSICHISGSLMIDFGLGKYQNRGVVDGFGGVSRGREQWTVRASRELRSAPEDAAAGPLRYEIIEPLSRVRFILEPNEIQPISFDVVLTGVTQPFFDERNLDRDRRTGRIDNDVIRYHQGGWASGTVTVDGDTHKIEPDEWFGFRDHSWGVRRGIGLKPRAPRQPAGPAMQSNLKWMPAFFRSPAGSYHDTAVFLLHGQSWANHSAHVNESDGRQTPAQSITANFTFDSRTRFPISGQFTLGTPTGERVIEVEVLEPSGFFLRTGGYGGWGGYNHGTWMGALDVSGEYIPDCWDDEHLASLGQFRDAPVRVRDGDAVGYGILESIIRGVWPELGLTEDSDRPEVFG